MLIFLILVALVVFAGYLLYSLNGPTEEGLVSTEQTAIPEVAPLVVEITPVKKPRKPRVKLTPVVEAPVAIAKKSVTKKVVAKKAPVKKVVAKKPKTIKA